MAVFGYSILIEKQKLTTAPQGPLKWALAATRRHKQKKRNRMTNLLQENIEMKSPRTNSTFGFLTN